MRELPDAKPTVEWQNALYLFSASRTYLWKVQWGRTDSSFGIVEGSIGSERASMIISELLGCRDII
jgi:hypothetical protein